MVVNYIKLCKFEANNLIFCHIQTGGCTKPPLFIAKLLEKLVTSDFLKKDFSLITTDSGDNASDILHLLHQETNIRCSLVIGNDPSFASTDVLNKFMAAHSICKFHYKHFDE